MKLTKLYKTLLKENMLDEDYPESFNMEYFKKLGSFNARVKYCEQELQRISSGSSRIAYKIDDEKVLKLAKNKKGLAQNHTESELGGSGWYSAALAQTFEAHPDDLWVEMELARPVKDADFKKCLNMDLSTLYGYLNYYYYDSVKPQEGRKRGFQKFSGFKQEVYDWMWEEEFFHDLFSMIGDYDVPPGDLGKKSTYGLVHRDGKDTIVIIDFGLTGQVYDSFYS